MKQDEIELIVDEPIPGHFYWVLLKQDNPHTQPRAVECASGPMPTYSSAMRAGIAALQKRNDERCGLTSQRPPISGFGDLHVNLGGGSAG
ncbi:hypothetical protein QTI66_27535 [Variovorax sp. J22R133]|uniref:hypothetical protein n=1 Tax=Variovorax brevis TaxID=3053503 RepID=UPI0025774816|nr:hypothetical protein [Variovorax sp. J22R133]MDM0115932.1 hypothetical protein [Variovorax sp. J22R133]